MHFRRLTVVFLSCRWTLIAKCIVSYGKIFLKVDKNPELYPISLYDCNVFMLVCQSYLSRGM